MAVTIRDFVPGDEAGFRLLNEEWITRYFSIEPEDEAIFADPKHYVLDRGGRIFLAMNDSGNAVGTCALLAMTPGEFEVAKMGVTAAHQGQGIGRKLLDHAIREARSMGARRLFIASNKVLHAALRIYENAGFRHIPAPQGFPYARADVFMELLLRRV
jgi:GNAT superfamily N-acetyltransferase